MDTSCRGDYSICHGIILFIFPGVKRFSLIREMANLFWEPLIFLNKKRIIELEIESLDPQIGYPIIGQINKLFATYGDRELLFIYGI